MMKWLIVAFFIVNVAASTYDDNVATRSIKIEGILKCSKEPLVGAVIRVFKNNTEDLGQVIATGKTDSTGKFSVEGDTARFSAAESEIEPFLRIYHQCEEKKSYKRVQLQVPKDFVSLGKMPRRTYNIGLLNLELGYPGQTTVKTVEGL
ncbi:unnamed protein product [Bursaphelenchus okinawaensis]|uniref:Transthyretin-like family protein n=1 Tax=Bursaphelenchus okinawaensis TaxID=465554 RepID=A0A811KC09_9BILA|nr:unnamed protein product [Bursaphelenchus okinawaensis]CAG9097529.1 unnamed protein product [Bursaphelenchus okinawaensis]